MADLPLDRLSADSQPDIQTIAFEACDAFNNLEIDLHGLSDLIYMVASHETLNDDMERALKFVSDMADVIRSRAEAQEARFSELRQRFPKSADVIGIKGRPA